jgi:hypothetical protein
VPTDAVICDGSDEVRLWTQTTNDFHPPQEGFRIAYGSKYLAIDGKCNFWAASPDGLFTGTITDQTVLADYEASYFGKLARFADYDPGPSIPDSDLAYVADTSGQVSINTSGAADPPEGYEETWAAINQLTDDLVQAGERSAGPLRILMVVGEVISPEPWPLELDPKPWVAENFPGDEKRPDAGIWLNAGETANALRATGEGTYAYTGAAGTEYLQLFLRDEVPPKVLAALIRAQKTNSLNGAEIGATCDETEDCSNRLTCMTHSESGGGGSACNTCIAPGAKGADWECQSNDDCCGGLVCCVDCGDQSGTCIAEPDPCETCVGNEGSFVQPNQCRIDACEPDSSCFTSECPGLCADDNCGGCGRPEECWAAGCDWDDSNENAVCGPSAIETLPESCAIDATDASLPGVTVHLEGDSCNFASGQGGQFRYTVELNQTLDFTTTSSNGSCGLCGVATVAETWIDFVISDGAQTSYCPECDIGCCAPTEAEAASLSAQATDGTVDWPGLEWSGPSDTSEQPAGAFPPGSYAATVTLSLPGLGQVVATLPIEVTE